MRAVVLAIVLTTAFQAPPPPPPPLPPPSPADLQPRATAAVPASGAASIIGTVMTDEANPRPVRRAVISITMPGVAYSSRMTSTNDQGEFALVALPAGTYGAPIASKPGYVSKTFGAIRYGTIGTPITLSDAQIMRVEFKLTRGAVITGTVFDQGRPSPQTGVNAMRVREINGVRTQEYAGGAGYAATDDRGVYRVYGLPPGDYVVYAQPRYTYGETRTITESDIDWAQRQFQGGGAATTSPASAPTPPPAGPAVTYSPVYYPGVTKASAAALVTVAAGQERSGVDFTARLVTTARIEGVILDLNGEPTDNAQINLVPRMDGTSLDSMMMMESMMFSRPVVTAGRFSLPGVRPGDYTLVVRGAARDAGGAGGRGGSGAGGGRGSSVPPAMPLWASMDFTVEGADLTGLVVRLAAGIDLKGRVEFEAGSTLKQPGWDAVRVRMMAAPTAGSVVTVNVPNVAAEPDGTFTLKNVTPGKFLILATAGSPVAGQSWLMKSARIGEIDAGDIPFDPMNHGGSEIIVTMTDKGGELSGTLYDANIKPTSQLSIILFPANPALWNSRTRRLRPPVRASTDGRFRFTNILEGDYLLAALADFEQADVFKPEFLEQIASSAMKVTIGPGEKKVQDLRIAGK